MGALAYELRRGDRPAKQPRLFAVPDGVGVGAVAEPAPVPVAGAVVTLPVVAQPPRPVRTLDDVVGGLFGTLSAGRQTACVLCGGAVRPQPVVAGAPGVGRCDGCGTRYEGG